MTIRSAVRHGVTSARNQLQPALAGPTAVAPVAVAAYFVASIVYGLLRQIGTGGSVLPAIAVALVASCVSTAVLSLVGVLRCHTGDGRGWLAIVGYAIAGASNAVASMLIGTWLFADSTAEVPVRFVVSSAYEATAWMVLVALITASAAAFRTQMDSLRRQQDDLATRRAACREALNVANRRLGELVDRNVTARLSDLLADTLVPLKQNPSPPAMRAAASEISTLSKSVVRPMSHSMDSGDAVRGEQVDTSSPSRDANPARVPELVNELARDMAVRRLPTWLMTAVAVGLLVGPLWSLRGIPVGSFIVAVDVVVFAAVLTAFNWVAGDRVTGLPHTASLSFQFAAAALAGTVVLLAANLVLGEQPRTYAELIAAGWALVVGVGSKVIVSGRNLARRARSSLSATVALADWETKRLDSELLNAQRRVGHVLHGEIQGGLTAASLLLHQGASQPSEQRAATVARTAALVGDIVAEAQGAAALRPHAANQGVRAGLAQIADSWQGILDVEIAFPEPVIERIQRSDAVSQATLEVFREALANAARHGYSSSVSAHAATVGDRIVFDFLDDGTGPQRGAIEAGLGIRAIRRTGADCDLTARPEGGAHLRVTIPAPV